MTILSNLLQLQLDIRGQVDEQAVEGDVPFAGMTFGQFISVLLQAIMTIAAVSVFIFLIWGAVDYINSSGEKSKIESARNKMTGAVFGIFVLAIVLVVYMFVQRMLGIDVLQFDSGPSTPPSGGFMI